jgi:hypothetical protein
VFSIASGESKWTAVQLEGIGMTRLKWIAIIVAAVVLVGCGGVPTRSDSSLSALHLFGPDGQPRFAVAAACSGLTDTDDMQCATLTTEFYKWGQDRHIKLRIVEKNDPVMQGAPTATIQRRGSSEPAYFVTIYVEPLVEPSFHMSGGGAPMYGGTSGFQPGSIGYRSEIRIFSASTGKLVWKAAPHHSQTMPDNVNVTPAFKAEVRRLINNLDPSYAG